MKKYLMTGMAALALCAAFTSCSKETNLYNEEVIKENTAQEIINNYNEAFIKTFGQPAANHQWGFVDYSKANTRATGEFADHVGAYPDANMWTSKGFYAPDPLTASQKLRAQYYFQMTHIENPNQPDNGTKDFFMQQVYDGGTDPMTGKSAEKYPAANGTTMIESGEHMDHLTVGTGHLHTYNFNNGNCSTNDNVADRDQTDVNDTSKQHSDEIQLMLNTPTSCFGYANSDASFVRDDRWTLVSAETIDIFCDGDAGFASWLADRLPAGEEDVKCVDEFNRSYIGFDFDMLPDDKLYVKENGEFKYFSLNLKGHDQVWDGEALVDATTVGEVVEEWGQKVIYPYIPGTTTKIRMISDQTNQYCGTSETISDAPLEYEVNDNGNVTKYVSLAKVYEFIDDYALPTSSGAGKTWITIGDCADGYYSDWIVTFMPASYNPPTPSEWDLRIICEDLNATAQEGDPEDSDWDFNDLVLDVKFLEGDNVRMRVYAVGATLPIRINGESGLEAHGLYGQPTNMMINTGAAAAGYPNQAYETNGSYPAAAIFEREIKDVKANYGSNIKIEVEKGTDNWVELEAKPGQPASKMGVLPDFEPCAERQDINGRYSEFVAWINTQKPVYWWRPAASNE